MPHTRLDKRKISLSLEIQDTIRFVSIIGDAGK